MYNTENMQERFFINWILANLILYYKRAFYLMDMYYEQALHGAKYNIAFIVLYSLIQLLKNYCN